MKRLTKEQAAIISAYTGILVGPFEEMHAYAEKLLGEPLQTMSFASEKLNERLREASKPDLLGIVRERPERCAECHLDLDPEHPGIIFETDTLTSGRLTTPLHNTCRAKWFEENPPTFWVIQERIKEHVE